MLIFSPGPANISDRVRKALTKPDICHRDIEFTDILSNIRQLTLCILKISSGYENIILGGSATAAIESVISSFGDYDKKILIISNGVYGERAADIARLYGIHMEEIRLAWGDTPDLDLIDCKLRMPDFGAVYIVHHETTTGLKNPLKEISSIGKKYGKFVLTDAVSSIAGEELDIANWGIDIIIGSPNKCIRAVPGISFIIASRRFLETIEKCRSRSYYANLFLHYKQEAKGQTPFTPAVQVFYAFEEALKELQEEGIDERIRKYKHIAQCLRRGLKDLGIGFFLPEGLRSNTMTVVRIPENKNYASLHYEFKKKGFVIYPSQGKLSETTFRLATVGIISQEDIEEFLAVFKRLL